MNAEPHGHIPYSEHITVPASEIAMQCIGLRDFTALIGLTLPPSPYVTDRHSSAWNPPLRM